MTLVHATLWWWRACPGVVVGMGGTKVQVRAGMGVIQLPVRAVVYQHCVEGLKLVESVMLLRARPWAFLVGRAEEHVMGCFPRPLRVGDVPHTVGGGGVWRLKWRPQKEIPKKSKKTKNTKKIPHVPPIPPVTLVVVSVFVVVVCGGRGGWCAPWWIYPPCVSVAVSQRWLEELWWAGVQGLALVLH